MSGSWHRAREQSHCKLHERLWEEKLEEEEEEGEEMGTKRGRPSSSPFVWCRFSVSSIEMLPPQVGRDGSSSSQGQGRVSPSPNSGNKLRGNAGEDVRVGMSSRLSCLGDTSGLERNVWS